MPTRTSLSSPLQLPTSSPILLSPFSSPSSSPSPSLASSSCSTASAKSLVQWIITKIFRMIPSLFLMLFVLSLLFVTLMQIVIIHADHKTLLYYSNWRSSVPFSSSTTSNGSTSISPSILKQMLKGLNYSLRADPRKHPQGLVNRQPEGTARNSSKDLPAASSGSSLSSAAGTAAAKKKPDVLKIEALVDRSLPSRDVNVKMLQNFVNSARIKEMIRLLQDRGLLDSSPDVRQHNGSQEHAFSTPFRDRGETTRRLRVTEGTNHWIEESRDAGASSSTTPSIIKASFFAVLLSANPEASAQRRIEQQPDADLLLPSSSLNHQTGSSRRSPGSDGNFDRENIPENEEKQKLMIGPAAAATAGEKANQAKRIGKKANSLRLKSSSSSQANQEIDFPAGRQEKIPEASALVNLTKRRHEAGRHISDRVSSAAAREENGSLLQQKQAVLESATGLKAHDQEENENRGFNELNPVDSLSGIRVRGNLSSTLIATRQETRSTSASPSSTSAFLRLMSDPGILNKTTCPAIPPALLGRIVINLEPLIGINMSNIVHNNPNVTSGGHFAPAACYARHRVAIIIPYRDRFEHLSILLYHLHPILQRQQLEYKIYVAEQFGNDTFNKGVLMNAGVREALREADYHCFVFHDVDLIPEDDRNLYSCPISPRHMSYAVDKFNYTLPYNYLVGGVFAISKEHLIQVNGYSNLYWGWGAEDDDMSHRLKLQNLQILRPPVAIGRYTMIKHTHRTESPSSVRQALLRMAKRRASRDGLSSVRYTIRSKIQYPLYTHLIIEIGHIHKWHFASPNKLVLHF